ncbi:hypothetical protein QBC46DRAFT_453475 [Diplogelasinospora grovesii]|uniref:Rhodopsin domain-containing protein n=1 Tax=Diplogelasinospora grovesii TaxID=303347 RepID=A0AAN6MYG2_9PEZI|nr:hypothetical protein QBC46DRAFT_453475 [Diplogelasinospora grovesii]
MASTAAPSSLPPDVDRGVDLQACYWTLIAITTIFFALRIWARIYKRLGWDDFFMACAWVCMVAEGIIMHFIAASGGTRHFLYLSLSQQEHNIKLQLIALIIGIACTAFGKIAIGITILRIVGNTSAWQKWSVWFTIIVTAVTSTIDIFLTAFRCGSDVKVLWTFELMATAKCLPQNPVFEYNTFAAAWQAFADFFFSLLPMAVVWKLRLPLSKRLYLIGALGLTAFTGIAGSVKTSLSASLASPTDPTWDVFALYIWASVESMLIIVCGSIPALHPLWERFLKPRIGTSQRSGFGYQVSGNSHGFASSRSQYMQTSSSSKSIVGYSNDTKENMRQIDITDVELARLTGQTPQAPAIAVTVAKHDIKTANSWLDDSSGSPGLAGRIHVVKDVDVSSGRSVSLEECGRAI